MTIFCFLVSKKSRHDNKALIAPSRCGNHAIAQPSDDEIRRILKEMLLDIEPLPINYSCMYDRDWLLGPEPTGCAKCAKRKLSLKSATNDLEKVLKGWERNYTLQELVQTYKPMRPIQEVKELVIMPHHAQCSAISLQAEVL